MQLNILLAWKFQLLFGIREQGSSCLLKKWTRLETCLKSWLLISWTSIQVLKQCSCCLKSTLQYCDVFAENCCILWHLFQFSPFLLGSNSADNVNTLIDLGELEVLNVPPQPPPQPPPLLPSALNTTPTLTPAPALSEIPILPPPPQATGHSWSHSIGHAESIATQSTSAANSLSLLDEELLCLGQLDAVWRCLMWS